ncbi:hypothetical protein [Neptunomonas sp.]|uniref:hypothetical protein n=1 Tax=Neptunomonas sp. TaxID=1971898 RepID=UPI003569D50A
MMIADLVDQEDFCSLLESIGISVKSDWTSEQCAQAAIDWRCINDNPDAAAKLNRIINELKQKESLLLPEVKAALNMLLLHNSR